MAILPPEWHGAIAALISFIYGDKTIHLVSTSLWFSSEIVRGDRTKLSVPNHPTVYQ
ncbi:MAG: hypothetical protein AB4042_09015 [Leptolyngbyaceae cyanobacterium]